MISLKKAVKWAYQDFNSNTSKREVVYRITFLHSLFDDLYFTIDYIRENDELIFGFKVEGV